jgi:hypothetical protein
LHSFSFKHTLEDLFQNEDSDIEIETLVTSTSKMSTLFSTTNLSVFPTPTAYSSKPSDTYQMNKNHQKKSYFSSKASSNSSIDIFSAHNAKISNHEISCVSSPQSKISTLLKKINASSLLEQANHKNPTPPNSNLLSSYKCIEKTKYQTQDTPFYPKTDSNSNDVSQTKNLNKRIKEIDTHKEDTKVNSIKDLLSFMSYLD